MSIKNVVLAGAGGNLGPTILNGLLEGGFKVTVLSREGSKGTFPDGVDVVHANYESLESLTTALKGQDALVSTVGAGGLAAQTRLIDAAIAAGIKRYIPSEFGSDTTDPKVVEKVPAFKGKVQVVDYLKSKESEISWTSVITGAFFDWGILVGFTGLQAATKTATLIDNGEGVFAGTNIQQIGRGVAKILQKLEETKNQYVYLSDFTVSQKQLLQLAEKITGEKWTVEHVSSADLHATGTKKIEAGDYSGVVELIKSSAFTDAGNYTSKGIWNEKLGLPKQDLEESLKAPLQGKLYEQ